MDEVPTFREIMDLARNEGMYSVHKCVLEHTEKRAKWKEVEGAPKPNKPITADHVIAYNNFGFDDGEYHPNLVEWGWPQRWDDFKINRELATPSMHLPFLNLSRRNSGKIRGSNGYLDSNRSFKDFDERKRTGFTAQINPKTHKVFNNVDDWIAFVQKYPLKREYNGSDWYFPHLVDITKNGIHSMEWNKAFFDDLRRSRSKLWDAGVGFIDELKSEPQIAVLTPDAIMSTEPYDWREHANRNSYEKHNG